jgi:glycerophosphoryl diester phosphodiesterase
MSSSSLRASFIVCLGLATVTFAGSAWAQSSPAETLLHTARPLVIAHRGYSVNAPENTLLSFQRGLTAGADMVELDYHHTKEGELMVLHDYTLDRTTDATNRWGGKGFRIADHAAEEIGRLEAGLWFNPPQHGLHVPTLAQALDVIQRGGVTLIERKAGDAATCVKFLRERGLINRVIVQAFDWNYLREFRRLETNQVLGALGPPSTRNGRKLTEAEKALGSAWLEEVQSLGAQAVVWNKQVDAAAMADAHRRGLKVWIYTIDDDRLARRLLGLGVDGLITDNPAIIWRTLALERLR